MVDLVFISSSQSNLLRERQRSGFRFVTLLRPSLWEARKTEQIPVAGAIKRRSAPALRRTVPLLIVGSGFRPIVRGHPRAMLAPDVSVGKA